MISARLLLLILVFSIIIPTFDQSVFGVVLSSIAFFGPGLVAGFLLLKRSILINKKILYLISIYSGIFVLLTFSSLIYDADRLVFSDVSELVRPILIFFIVLAFSAVQWKSRRIKLFYYFLASLIILSFCLSVLELSGTRLSSVILQFYVRERGSLQNKAIAFFSTPYFAGSVYLFCASFFIAYGWASRKKRWLTIGALSLLLSLMTQSRTVFLAMVVFVILLVVVKLFRDKMLPFGFLNPVKFFKFTMFFTLLTGTLFAFVYAFQDKLSYLLTGIEVYLINIEDHLGRDSGSVGTRMSQIRFALENNNLYFIGVGIGKGYAPSLESIYALFYYRYGILGFLVYAVFWLAVFFLSIKKLRQTDSKTDPEFYAFFLGFAMFIPIIPILSLSSVITDQYRLYPIFYGAAGILLSLSIGKYKVFSTTSRCTEVS